jgi:hypothetical protein
VEGFSPCDVETFPAIGPEQSHGCPRTFFATTRTADGRSLFQTERMADLFIDVLRSTMRSGKITVHDFVVYA